MSLVERVVVPTEPALGPAPGAGPAPGTIPGNQASAGGGAGPGTASSAASGDRPGRFRPCGGHLAVVGTTASGKSALALALAAARPGTEIVSIDSMAVYREMDIATAKPAPAERAAVAHHMIDVADPAEEYGVARFQHDALAVLADVERRGRRAVLVGGTGLYLRALIDDLDLPGQWPDVAAEVARDAAAPGGLAELHRRLARLDPVAAARIEPGNHRRLVRALEVTLGSGRPFSSFGPGLERYAASPVVQVGVPFDRAAVDHRIGDRLARWMEAGLLQEVRALAGRARGLSRTARQALAYRELLAHVESGADLVAAVTEAERRTRALARRQWSWFRRDPRVRWLDPSWDLVGQALAHWGAPDDTRRGGVPVPTGSRL